MFQLLVERLFWLTVMLVHVRLLVLPALQATGPSRSQCCVNKKHTAINKHCAALMITQHAQTAA